MTIFKLDYLKSFENDLKQQLAIDKKYLPISKKLVAILREINPYLESIDKNLKILEEEFIAQNLQINKSYAENLENYTKSLKIIIEKNKSEIEKNQKSCHQKIHDLNHQFKLSLENIDQKIDQVTQTAKDKIKDAELIYSRDVSSFNKIINEAKRKYQETTLAIENEKKISVERAILTHEQKIKEIDENLSNFSNEIGDKIEQIKAETQYLNNENDNIYLSIKNNYSQLAIQFNKKINELKKHYTHALTVVNKEHQAKVKPVEKAIETLKASYQEAQQKALTVYSEKLTSLNVLFDLQKDNYEKKKEKIIHEANEAITLLNSKLSAYREQTAKEKLTTSREMRDLIKSMTDAHERDKTNHQLTRKLNAYDNELNKQIIRTNKDILDKHRTQQRRLFLHDQAHLKEINEWRMQKALVEYEKKQEFAKIDLNFHHNMELSEQSLKLIHQEYDYKKDVLLLTHNKDLLPLEYQLAIAQGLQERELNLLANDAHLLIADSKLNEKRAENELEQKVVQADFERKKATTLHQADLQVLNITIQLEMEKAKARRDFEITEQELRTELTQLILNKTKTDIEFDLNYKVREIELDKEIDYLENKFKLDTFKHELNLEIEKRNLVVNEAKYKNQQRVSNEKANRLLKMYRNELEFNQEQTTSFVAIIRKMHVHQMLFRDTIIELYHLPSHPEVLKEVIKIIMGLNEQISQSFLSILEYYQMKDHAFYMKKIEDLTGYKYMLKHEDMMNFYDSEIQKIQEKRLNIETEIKALEDSFFASQTLVERNQAFINQLNKIGQGFKSNTLESKHKHQDIKENQKLIANHDHEIKRIKQQLIRIENDIDKKHKNIMPLDDELQKVLAKQKDAEKDLASMKHHEAAIFYKYLNKNQAVYQRLALHMSHHDQQIKDFMKTLSDEVYLSDNFINQLLKKHKLDYVKYENFLEKEHLSFLDLMLMFYKKNEKEQKTLIQGFQHSSKSLIMSLGKNYDKRLNVLNDTHKKLEKDKNHHIQLQKEKFKKKSELERMMHQKKIAVDQLTLRDLENKIQRNGLLSEQELKTINENQVSIALQYGQNYETQVSHLNSDFQKQLAAIFNSFDQAVKLLETQTAQIETKNQLILTKYEQTYQKQLIGLDMRRKSYDDQVRKHIDNHDTRIKNLESLIKRMNQKRENELKNIQFHLKKFNMSTKYEQNKVLNKEMKVLRKSHRFRVKMLQLN